MISKPPIFIIGSPRSGTTLIRLMVTSHRNIVVPPECGFAVWWKKKYDDWQRGDERLTEFLKDLATSKKIETWKLDFKVLRKAITAAKPASYAELISVIYQHYAAGRNPQATRWGDKNNFYLNHIRELREMFPDAPIIHIVRDGRDVCCSYRQLHKTQMQSDYAPKLPFEPGAVAAEWGKNIITIRDAFADLDWQGVSEVRYEDLVSRPEAELKKLCAAIGEDFDAGMLDYAAKNREQELEPVEFLQWKKLTLEAPTTEQTGRYRRDLSHQDIADFESIAGSQLRHYDYL